MFPESFAIKLCPNQTNKISNTLATVLRAVQITELKQKSCQNIFLFLKISSSFNTIPSGRSSLTLHCYQASVAQFDDSLITSFRTAQTVHHIE